MKIVLAFALMLTVTFVYGQSPKLNLASDVWPPFTDVTPKYAFALDLVHEALARTKIQEHTDILDFKEVMNGINNRKFDGSAALWRNPEREKYLLFSDPYLENRLILVGKKGSDVSAAALSELKGKRVAVVESYAYGSLLDGASDVVLEKGSNDQQNLERLLRGQVDYMLVDALLIEYLLNYQKKEAAEYLAIGTNTLLKLPLHFAIRREVANAEKIIANFNAKIREMMIDGSYNRILKLSWVASDVDGDGLPELVLSGNKAGTEAPANGYALVSEPGGVSMKSKGYVIEGKVYSSWEAVPAKYKVSTGPVPPPAKQGFGLSLSF